MKELERGRWVRLDVRCMCWFPRDDTQFCLSLLCFEAILREYPNTYILHIDADYTIRIQAGHLHMRPSVNACLSRSAIGLFISRLAVRTETTSKYSFYLERSERHEIFASNGQQTSQKNSKKQANRPRTTCIRRTPSLLVPSSDSRRLARICIQSPIPASACRMRCFSLKS